VQRWRCGCNFISRWIGSWTNGARHLQLRCAYVERKWLHFGGNWFSRSYLPVNGLDPLHSRERKKTNKNRFRNSLRPGVDVTRSQFSAIFANFPRKNWRFFSKTNVMINFSKTSSSLSKNVNFRQFWRKYFKNHNIGPWVARWYGFIPKIPIWVYSWGPWKAKCWHVLCPFVKFNCHLVYVCNGHLVY
jgi:hypothetical protein